MGNIPSVAQVDAPHEGVLLVYDDDLLVMGPKVVLHVCAGVVGVTEHLFFHIVIKHSIFEFLIHHLDVLPSAGDERPLGVQAVEAEGDGQLLVQKDEDLHALLLKKYGKS